MSRDVRVMLAIVLIALGAGLLSHRASRRMSATFDEIVLVAGGVRGVQAGRWEMITDQPPLMMYAYGLAAGRAVRARPPETRPWDFNDRWTYARGLFFRVGNDPQEMLGRARAVAALVAALLVISVGLFGWWASGPAGGVLGALMTALVPDVLAHGGVAYNDLPLALTFLLSLWAFDAAIRKPSPLRAVLAAAALVLAFGTKLSALGVLPVMAVLLVMEGALRWREAAWRRDLLVSGVVAVLAAYVGFVLLYRGDPALTLLRFNFFRTVLHASGGHEAPAYLMGQLSARGWWYYFPLALLFKTPVGLQALLVVGGLGAADGAARARETGWHAVLAWKGRAALVGALVFLGFLLRSELNAGVRYALPLIPLLIVAAACGLDRVWSGWGRAGSRAPVVRPGRSVRSGRTVRSGRLAVAALVVVQAASVLAVYPQFLAFGSVWAGRSEGLHTKLLDSNLDWGQGLLELKAFMEAEGVSSVRLSYFGSAPPDAYGIDYVALPSFFPLQPARTAGAKESPRFTVISATNLYGIYLGGDDPFADYRSREPYGMIGHSLFVFDEAARLP